MSAPLTAFERAELEAELEADFGLTFAQVLDLEQLPSWQRAPIVEGWRAMGKLAWTVEPSRWDRFVAILGALVSIANPVIAVTGAVTGVAGAIVAIRGL